MKKMAKLQNLLAAGFFAFFLFGCRGNLNIAWEPAVLDLSRAEVVVLSDKPVHAKAADLLVDEVEKRSALRWRVARQVPEGDAPVIIMATVAEMNEKNLLPATLAVPEKAEAYTIFVSGRRVYLAGRDDRGVLFAAGRLLRMMEFSRGRAEVSSELRIASAPQYPIRGHQLGYRSLNNTYDKWDVADYEQYLRDLIIFGTNTLELIPRLEPDGRPGQHMKMSMWEMNKELSLLAGSYGLDVTVWMKVMHAEIKTEELENDAMAKRRAVFESFEHLDAVFVPGGDGGDTPVEILLPWLGRLAKVLREVHPDATLWVSNQTFDAKSNDYFFAYLQREQPEWLEGVVYGPWTTISLPRVRERLAKRYKLRRYPDVCHCLGCEYPVPEWDRAFSQTHGREPICPRPRQMESIHNKFATFTVGFVSYSDGVNDDFNKFLWTALAWDTKASVENVAREYGKMFFGDAYAKMVGKGLLKLEENWVGPIAENDRIEETLGIWNDIANRGGEELRGNWRFQMYLFRAYYDAYLKKKVNAEAGYERDAYEGLMQAKEKGAGEAIAAARKALSRTDIDKPGQKEREWVEKLGMELFNSIGFQLSVKEPYNAVGMRRGAVLDYLDRPLNNRLWLEEQFVKILAQMDVSKQYAMIDEIVNWEDAGPGGFYDDLGFAGREPHLVRQKTWEDDPWFLESPYDEQYYSEGITESSRLSWRDQAQIRYGMGEQPPEDQMSDTELAAAKGRALLTMRYDDLEKDARYRVKVTYYGRFKPMVRLVADGKYEVHAAMVQPEPAWPVEFDVPIDATKDGVLELQWEVLNKARGAQVAEVWLIRN